MSNWLVAVMSGVLITATPATEATIKDRRLCPEVTTSRRLLTIIELVKKLPNAEPNSIESQRLGDDPISQPVAVFDRSNEPFQISILEGKNIKDISVLGGIVSTRIVTRDQKDITQVIINDLPVPNPKYDKNIPSKFLFLPTTDVAPGTKDGVPNDVKNVVFYSKDGEKIYICGPREEILRKSADEPEVKEDLEEKPKVAPKPSTSRAEIQVVKPVPAPVKPAAPPASPKPPAPAK